MSESDTDIIEEVPKPRPLICITRSAVARVEDECQEPSGNVEESSVLHRGE